MPWKYHDQTYIPKSAAELWPLISTLEGLKKWSIRDGGLDPVPGGEFHAVWNEGAQATCQIAEIIPNERFAFNWNWTIKTRIDFWLEPAEDGVGTYFHIEQGDFPEEKDFEGVFFAYMMGWTKYIMCLKAYVMAGIDMRDVWVW